MDPVDEFIASAKPELQPILQRLRHIVLKTSPLISEEIKWKIPYYSYNGMLCYLNPRKKSVDLGFSYGAKLSNAQGLLTGSGSVVKHITIYSLDEIDEDGIMSVLKEAMYLNEIKI